MSEIVTRKRIVSGGRADLEQRHCLDGYGRTVQTRTRLSEGVYQVTGFHEVNPRSLPVRVYDGYQGGGDCDVAPPANVAFQSHVYDALDRPLRITEPDAELYGQPSLVRFEYGPLSVTTFDPEDNDPQSRHFNTPSRQVRDGLGRAVGIERSLRDGGPSGRVTALWDSLGGFAGYVDAAGNRKLQTRDLLGRLTAVDDPNSGRILFDYDAAGNLIARTDARGVSVKLEYDGANRPQSHYDPERRRETEVRTTHDFVASCTLCTRAEAHIATVTYPLGQERGPGTDEHGYDLREREVAMVRTLEGHRFTVDFGYENADRLVRKSLPDGTVLDTRYDGASRPTAINGVLDSVDYDPRGVLSELRYANGTRSDRTHDVRQRLTRIRTLSADDTVLQGFDYRHDRAGNVLGVTDLTGERPDGLGSSVQYFHDAWYRLTRAQYADGEAVNIGYDLLDNITGKVSSMGTRSAAHVGSYESDKSRPNAIARAGELVVNHDAAGHVVARGGLAFEWDHLARLVESKDEGGQHGESVYGPGPDAVMELQDGGVTYHVDSDFEVRDGIAIAHARLGREPLARLSSDRMGTALLPDHNGNGRIDVGDEVLASDGALPDRMRLLRGATRRALLQVTSRRAWLHADHLGSLSLASGEGGEVLGERVFYPAGTVRAQHGHVGTLGFTGQRHDRTSGLVRFRFRALDPHLARWQSPDPLFERSSAASLQELGQATTAYAYVGNRIVDAVDPTGLMAEASPSFGTAKRVSFAAQSTAGVHEIPARVPTTNYLFEALSPGDRQMLARSYTNMRTFVSGPDGRRHRVLSLPSRGGATPDPQPIVNRRTSPTGLAAFARHVWHRQARLSLPARALLFSAEGQARMFYEAASDDSSVDSSQ